MIRKVYTLTTSNYDYFATCGGARSFKNGYRHTQYYNLIEAHKALVESKQNDYDYGDSYQRTVGLTVRFEYVPDVQRWHARSEWEWEKELERRNRQNTSETNGLFIDGEELEYLLSLIDTADEEILI